MKRTALGLALGLPLLIGLPGCASRSTVSSSAYEVDSARVAAIERAARQAGVGVIWVNQPRKKTAVAGG